MLYDHSMIALSEGKIYVTKGYLTSIPIIIEIKDMNPYKSFHFVQTTGMYELLGKNMC